MAVTSGPKVDLLLGERVDPGAWEARHGLGQVPDRLPYGLDRLADHGVMLARPRSSASRTGAARALRAASRLAGGRYDWGVLSAWRPGADAVLGWSEQVGVPVALAHGRRIPVVTGLIWATDSPPAAHVRRLVVQGLRRARGVFVLSSAQVAPLVDGFGLEPRRVHVVPFGVDTGFFAPREVAVDRDLIVSVGNDRHRDWPGLLAAFAEVRRRRPATRLTVVSSTVPDSLTAGLPPGRGVTVVPRLGHHELRELVASAAACLVTTGRNLHASGVTAALEGQSMGRPVVATAQPGMDDYASDGLTLVPPGDPAAAAREVLLLLEDPPGADAAGAAGRQAVTSHFSTHHQAAALAAVVQEAVR